MYLTPLALISLPVAVVEEDFMIPKQHESDTFVAH